MLLVAIYMAIGWFVLRTQLRQPARPRRLVGVGPVPRGHLPDLRAHARGVRHLRLLRPLPPRHARHCHRLAVGAGRALLPLGRPQPLPQPARRPARGAGGGAGRQRSRGLIRAAPAGAAGGRSPGRAKMPG